MRHVTFDEIGPGMVALLGIPWDEESSFLRGAAQAPSAVREALASPHTNWCAENGHDLRDDPRFVDLGDLTLGTGSRVLGEIERGVRSALAAGASVISIGGDHAITYPVVRAFAGAREALSILHLDAHPDLYHEFEGSRYSHACPFARILEEGLARRLVQVGIRTMTRHQREQADRFGVEVVDMRAWRSGHSVTLDGTVYLSIDLDVLDPAYAPGVSHHEPGGLTTRDVLEIVQTVQGRLVGADIVELNPHRDAMGITAVAAAKIVKELAARMLTSGTRDRD